MTGAHINRAITRALAALFLIGLSFPALSDDVVVPTIPARPDSDRISASQFRDNPALLDRHPMEVDDCRLTEHWQTGFCYIYSLQNRRKVSEYTDVPCTDLDELRRRMTVALDSGVCAATSAPVVASQRADAVNPTAPSAAASAPGGLRSAIGSLQNEALQTFFLYRLSWVLPILFLIGWVRWWPLLVLPGVYILSVRAVSGFKFGASGYPADAFSLAFAIFGIACVAVVGAGALAGRWLRKSPALPPQAAAYAGSAVASTPRRKIRQSVGSIFSDINRSWAYSLPYSKWAPLWAGTAAGVALRLVFSGKPGHSYAAMMAAFIYLSPLLVGAITVYVAESSRRRSWAYYIWAPFIANVLYVIGTLIINLEGVICAILIVPMFALLGSIGGLIMGAVCRATHWPRPIAYSLAVLPLVLGFVETGVPLPERVSVIERKVVIEAAPETVWRQISNVRDIRPDEVDNAWIYRIGVPLPEAGITQATPSGLVRRITMGKNIHFDQVVTDWVENRYVHWTYRFDEDSFPPYALDDHVVLGGHYFDVQDTSYTLTPKGSATELAIRMKYRVSTQFNWYAAPIAAFLFGNFEEVILDFYRRRSEAQPASRQARLP